MSFHQKNRENFFSSILKIRKKFLKFFWRSSWARSLKFCRDTLLYAKIILWKFQLSSSTPSPEKNRANFINLKFCRFKHEINVSLKRNVFPIEKSISWAFSRVPVWGTSTLVLRESPPATFLQYERAYCTVHKNSKKV